GRQYPSPPPLRLPPFRLLHAPSAIWRYAIFLGRAARCSPFPSWPWVHRLQRAVFPLFCHGLISYRSNEQIDRAGLGTVEISVGFVEVDVADDLYHAVHYPPLTGGIKATSFAAPRASWSSA